MTRIQTQFLRRSGCYYFRTLDAARSTVYINGKPTSGEKIHNTITYYKLDGAACPVTIEYENGLKEVLDTTNRDFLGAGAFFGNEIIKSLVVNRVRLHIQNGDIIKNTQHYWDGSTGSASGCTVHGYPFLFEWVLNIPPSLAILEDIIVGLTDVDFALDFLEAIPPGADLQFLDKELEKFANRLREVGKQQQQHLLDLIEKTERSEQ